MTKQHFIRAAEIVRSIRVGDRTMALPSWAEPYSSAFADDGRYARAIQTAKAFLLLFKEYNPRFDEQRFLQACGLVEKPVKKGR